MIVLVTHSPQEAMFISICFSGNINSNNTIMRKYEIRAPGVYNVQDILKFCDKMVK